MDSPAGAGPAPADPYAIETPEALAAHYEAPRELVLRKVAPRLEARSRAFIAASPFCLLATAGPEGVHCTPRGDAPGFIEALDDDTLALPDRRGNNRLDALRDILANPEVALLFLVPGVGEALRIGGRARITADPELRTRLAAKGRLPTTVLLVSVHSVYMQCGKAVLRSGLWQERRRPEGVPSMGELLAAHTGGLVEPASYDAEYPARIAATTY